MSKVVPFPSRRRQHDLERFFLAPGVVEKFPPDQAINWTRRISGWAVVGSLLAAAATFF